MRSFLFSLFFSSILLIHVPVLRVLAIGWWHSLTRELVISLCRESLQPPSIQPAQRSTSSNQSKPLVIYIDHQLRHSTRFDRPGLERDYPDWFKPLSSRHRFSRRLSRANSVSSVSSIHSNLSSHSSASNSTSDSSLEDGRLRYWTPEMCAKTPELFDLVITVSIRNQPTLACSNSPR